SRSAKAGRTWARADGGRAVAPWAERTPHARRREGARRRERAPARAARRRSSSIGVRRRGGFLAARRWASDSARKRCGQAAHPGGVGPAAGFDLAMAVAQASSTVGSATPKTERRPLPVEIIANVGVAVGGIEPQAAVQRERRIQLIDPLARIGDGRRNVR